MESKDPQPPSAAELLLKRIDRAIETVTKRGRALMSIPVQQDDVDIVLADCREYVEAAAHPTAPATAGAVPGPTQEQAEYVAGIQQWQRDSYQPNRVIGGPLPAPAASEQQPEALNGGAYDQRLWRTLYDVSEQLCSCGWSNRQEDDGFLDPKEHAARCHYRIAADVMGSALSSMLHILIAASEQHGRAGDMRPFLEQVEDDLRDWARAAGWSFDESDVDSVRDLIRQMKSVHCDERSHNDLIASGGLPEAEPWLDAEGRLMQPLPLHRKGEMMGRIIEDAIESLAHRFPGVFPVGSPEREYLRTVLRNLATRPAAAPTSGEMDVEALGKKIDAYLNWVCQTPKSSPYTSLDVDDLFAIRAALSAPPQTPQSSIAVRLLRLASEVADIEQGRPAGASEAPPAAVDVYNRPECIFNYCPQDETCRAQNRCQHARR